MTASFLRIVFKPCTKAVTLASIIDNQCLLEILIEKYIELKGIFYGRIRVSNSAFFLQDLALRISGYCVNFNYFNKISGCFYIRPNDLAEKTVQIAKLKTSSYINLVKYCVIEDLKSMSTESCTNV